MSSLEAKDFIQIVAFLLYSIVITIAFWGDPIGIVLFISLYWYASSSIKEFLKTRKAEKEQKHSLLLEGIKQRAETLLESLKLDEKPTEALVAAVEEDKQAHPRLLDVTQRAIFDDRIYDILELYYQIDLINAESYQDFLALMAMTKSNLKDVPASFRDKELCLIAIKSGSSLSEVPENIIDEELCREYVAYYPWNFYNISEKHLTRQLCFSWVTMINLDAIPIQFRDKEMCLEAMSEDYQLMGTYDLDDTPPFNYIPDSLQNDTDIVDKAKKIGWI